MPHAFGGATDTGRVVAYIEIDEIDLGARWVGRGLARPWYGRSSNFCSRPLAQR
jgi:endonuclease YncB( thermonuclease family)